MVRYEPAIDLGRIDALDVHVHVESDCRGNLSLDDELIQASSKYFRSGENRTPTVEFLAERYRRAKMAAVVFTVDASTNLGSAPLDSAEIAERCGDHADVLIPFGSVDPWKGEEAIEQAQSLVMVHGVRGFKFHPTLQGFAPNDEQHAGLWEAIEELNVPVLVHTGQNGIGAGLPGGRGLKLRYSDPLLMDDVAADHPNLSIILAHPSVPWQSEAISMATHKSNVFIDLSGWSPKYFPKELVRAAGGQLRKKVIFGSDYPLISPERWMADFDALGISGECKPAIFKNTAAAILGLSDTDGKS